MRAPRLQTEQTMQAAHFVADTEGEVLGLRCQTDRLRWLADVRAALERHGIGWAMWDYAGGFGVAVREQGGAAARLDPETAAALGLRAPKQ